MAAIRFTRPARWAVVVAVLSCWATAGSAAPPRKGKSGATPLGCSVEGIGSDTRQARFCHLLGHELGVPVEPLPDARHQQRGEAVQVFYMDVQLIVALVREGELRGWTRVPRDDSHRGQPARVARAVRWLRTHAETRKDGSCVQLKHRASLRNAKELDLVYPWAEFAHCESHMHELVEPWE